MADDAEVEETRDAKARGRRPGEPAAGDRGSSAEVYMLVYGRRGAPGPPAQALPTAPGDCAAPVAASGGSFPAKGLLLEHPSLGIVRARACGAPPQPGLRLHLP